MFDSVTGTADLFRVLDLTGVVANALLGGAVARAMRFDLVGFSVLAVVSGLGGGIIRDTLLQAGPPVALTDYRYLTAALLGALVAFAVRFEGRGWDSSSRTSMPSRSAAGRRPGLRRPSAWGWGGCPRSGSAP